MVLRTSDRKKYRLRDLEGNFIDINVEQLKDSIRRGELVVSNLTLTPANRLIITEEKDIKINDSNLDTLVIVTTDMEIEFAMYIAKKDVSRTKTIVSKSKEAYYSGESLDNELETTLKRAMSKNKIPCKIVPYIEMV